MTLTSAERERIAERAEKANPGPWFLYRSENGLNIQNQSGWICLQSARETAADFDFIAYARSDIPALLQALAAVEAERDEARMLLEHTLTFLPDGDLYRTIVLFLSQRTHGPREEERS